VTNKYLKAEDLIRDIRDIGYYIKEGYTVPLVNNLEIEGIFKNKDREKESSIIDLIL
jgi:hypothetical protein